MSDKKKYILVECTSTYRMRYAVALNADDPSEWACDTVVMHPDVELGQLWLGENIIGHREVSKSDLRDLAIEDCHAYENWTEDEIVDRLVIRPKVKDSEDTVDDSL